MTKTTIKNEEVQEVYDTFKGIGMAWDILLVIGFVSAVMILLTAFGVL